MSAAFKNFMLTLVIMLGIFAYAAIRILPDVENLIFIGNESGEETSQNTSDTSEESEESGNESSQETSSEEESDTFSCLFASKNKQGDICSLVYVEVIKETQKYITCRIPVDIYLDDSGVPKLLYELLGKKDTSYLLNKISPLIGKDVDYYVICSGDTYKTVAKITETSGKSVSVDLTYEVRYIDPDFADLVTPGEVVPEEYIITLPIGKVALTETNAAEIFNSLREGDQKNYAFQESMGLSVFRQVMSAGEFSENIETLTSFYNAVQTNIPISDLARYSSLLFAYSTYGNTHITYPTIYDYTSPDMKIADWSNGIKQIRNAAADGG
ncbi:MAG: hypothetical protein GX148_05730 [Clostridiales bacterium]|jgi:anionic cell wall polymer biosynthesis LytR-Cps2A-Psr (LCP) family protein|nr:hypothetical protein [Clostridiales bacterium]